MLISTLLDWKITTSSFSGLWISIHLKHSHCRASTPLLVSSSKPDYCPLWHSCVWYHFQPQTSSISLSAGSWVLYLSVITVRKVQFFSTVFVPSQFCAAQLSPLGAPLQLLTESIWPMNPTIKANSSQIWFLSIDDTYLQCKNRISLNHCRYWQGLNEILLNFNYIGIGKLVVFHCTVYAEVWWPFQDMQITKKTRTELNVDVPPDF